MRDFVIPSRGRAIEPGEDFIEQMRSHLDDPVTDAEFVPCPNPKIDLAHLKNPQLAYYVRWRDQLRKGNVMQSDLGYEYIRICELINLSEEREYAAGQIDLLLENRKLVKTNYRTLMAVRFDISAAFGDSIDSYLDSDDTRAVASKSALICTPISFIDSPERFCGNPLGESSFEYDDVDPEYFTASVRALDTYLINTTGKGILDTFGGSLLSVNIRLFDDFFYKGERLCRIDFTDCSGDTRLPEFLRAIYLCCTGVKCREDGREAPNVSRILTKEMRAIITRQYGAEPDPYDEEDKHLGAWSLSENGSRGVMIIQSGARECEVGSSFRDDIAKHAKSVSEECRYVPSGAVNPQYSTMSGEQLGFYLYWRDQARQGNFITTDSGYVWLRLCELINDAERDPMEVYGDIIALGNAYRDATILSDPTGMFRIGHDDLIMRTALDYAVDKGLEPPLESEYACTYTVNRSMLRALSEDIDLSLDAVKFFSNADRYNFRRLDENVAAVFSRMLRMIEGQVQEGIVEYCGIKEDYWNFSTYDRLVLFGPSSRECTISTLNFGDNEVFEENCGKLLSLIRSSLNYMQEGKKRFEEETVLFGHRFVGLTPTVLDCHGSLVQTPKASRSGLVLNRGEIESAQQALMSTVEMMKVEYEEEAVPEEPVKEEKPAEKGWKGFAEALDDSQMDLLKKLLAGEQVRMSPKVIDSINDISMDCIGDIIIDSGELVEDYRQDLSAVLKNS